MLYIRGLGVEKNPAQMYLWLTLSAESGDLLAAHDLPGLKEKFMSQEDVREGEQLVADYHAAHPLAASSRADPAQKK
jgi:TPR repeat protein